MTPTTGRPSKRDDLRELDDVRRQIIWLQKMLEGVYERRKAIFKRRLEAKDTTKAELAKATGITFMAVTFAVKDTPATAPKRGKG